MGATVNDSKQFACPHCGYDVRVAVQRSRKVCPECGERFRVIDGRIEPPTGNWGIVDELKQLVGALAFRTLIMVLPFAVAVFLGAHLPGRRPTWILAFIGIAVGVGYAWGFVERAGFTSMLLYVAAIAGLLVDAIAGALIVSWIVPPTVVGRVGGAALVIWFTSIFAAGWRIYHES